MNLYNQIIQVIQDDVNGFEEASDRSPGAELVATKVNAVHRL